jgi:acyl-CoA synthetase (AMP-forming)/AMP-acid ligase II
MISATICEALVRRERESDIIVSANGRCVSTRALRSLVGECARAAQPGQARWISEDDPVAFIAQCLACLQDGVPAIIGTRCVLGTVSRTTEPELPKDVAFVLNTSGSTGQTVGVMTTERSFVQNVRDMLPYVQPGQVERWFVCSPLSTSYGMSLGLWLPLFLGGTIHPVAYCSARACLSELGRGPRSAVVATPTVYRSWLEWPGLLVEAARLEPILFASGEPLPEAIARRYAALGLRLLDCYGSTETNGIAVCEEPGTGVFTPLASVQVELERSADGPGGTLLVKSPKVMAGYRGALALSKMRMREGWVATGDWIEPVGSSKFRILGRSSSLVKVAGQRVHPEQVERELESLSDVAEALVCAEADDRRGESLVAYVKPRAASGVDAGQLRALLAQRLPRYMVPRRIVLVAELAHASQKKARRSAPEGDGGQPWAKGES